MPDVTAPGAVTPLPAELIRLLDANTFFVLTTINPDGSAQSSVVWARRDCDEVLVSTILGRRKTRNMTRDPRVSLCGFDPEDPYRYVEVRGVVSLTEQGGPELIQELSRRYTGEAFREGRPGNVRVVCRIQPTKVIVRE